MKSLAQHLTHSLKKIQSLFFFITVIVEKEWEGSDQIYICQHCLWKLSHPISNRKSKASIFLPPN